jgi:hypothetical protein
MSNQQWRLLLIGAGSFFVARVISTLLILWWSGRLQ